MSALGGIYAWVIESLGSNTNINDFGTPVSYLTAAIVSLLVNGPNYQLFLPSPTLPQFLGTASLSSPTPWGTRNVTNTNPYVDIPNTGVTRHYDFTISRGVIAPDGISKPAILVNGQYPGPTIEANWGDYVQVTVHNQISGPAEGTTMHWHGTRQKGTPWFDGTPGISQCPIAPGSSLNYTFQADMYGTSWYHSHYSAQYLGGLYGPMVVYGPSSKPYDIDLGPILIHDYYHADYFKLIQNSVGNNTLTALYTPSDNTLIHGTKYVCDTANPSPSCSPSTSLAKFQFTTGKTHRLRLINPSSEASPILFSIDNHTMTVIANDYTPLVPYDTTVVSLSAGQRTDVLVKATADPSGTFWMRARQPVLCNFALQPFGLAAIYYDKGDTTSIPVSLPQAAFMVPQLGTCKNDPLSTTVPAYPIAADLKPDATVTITGAITVNSTGHTLYTMNGVPFRSDFNSPLLTTASTSRNTFPPSPGSNVYDFGNNDTVRIIFYNNLTFAHPMHLHGYTMSILSEGVGTWDGTITNPSNPQRRDTQMVQAGGYMVAQIQADNPGVWPFHCHIAWHLSAGMHANLITQQASISRSAVSSQLSATCKAWNAYSSGNTVDEIDSGI
ncbi:hypothetical protein MMC25_005999 [Agyrium rufum]|nr:hypothetical protein [Agyrium rufum]